MDLETSNGDKSPVCGLKLGRFVLLEPIGAGSMGYVFSAYDPELDRKVAIKLLRTEFPPEEGARMLAESTVDGRAWDRTENRTAAEIDEEALDPRQQRLLREAQAMARLSHPNVVTVYEVGTHGRDVFIAMQYIEGRTIRSWLLESSPGWQQILDVYRQAGAGLVEAHSRGMIHRDFKPDNVMIDGGGRVYVLDFGLVRSAEAVALEGLRDTLQSATPATEATSTKAVVGTPAYMSPEQLHARQVDARSDQFSFCVSLYEALFRERPFSGANLVELGEAMDRGVSGIPKGSQVPGWVGQVVVRGLEGDLERRWSSMESLLGALGQDPRARRRTVFRIAGGFLLMVLFVVMGLLFIGADRDPDCTLAARRLHGVWDADIRARGERSFVASNRPYAGTSWKHVESEIDGYSRDWMRAHQDACEATFVLHKQSESLLDLRMACLDQRLAALRTLSGRLLQADVETIDRAAELAGRLPKLAICSDVENLLAPEPLPAKGEHREQIQDAREQLAGLALGMRRGEHDEVLKRLKELEARAREIGYQPVLAEILLAKTRLLFEIRDLPRAAEACRDALVAAEAGSHRYLTTLIQTEMVRVEGFVGGRSRIHHPNALAQARIRGTRADEALDLTRIRYQAENLMNYLEPVEALDVLEPAGKRFLDQFGPDSLGYAGFLASYGKALYWSDKVDEAIEQYDKALSIFREKLGVSHPHVTTHLLEIAHLKVRSGDPRGARATMQVARDNLASLETKSIQMQVLVQTGWGEALSFSGDAAGAVRAFSAARAVAEEPDTPAWLRGDLYVRYGHHLFRQGKLEDAYVLGEKSLRAYEQSGGGNSIEVMFPLYLLGRIELARDRIGQAEPFFRQLVDITESRSRELPLVAYGLTGLGECLLSRGEKRRALEVLERAYRIRKDAPGWYWARPWTAHSLARAILASDADHERAARLATEALEDFSRVRLDSPRDRQLHERMADLASSLDDRLRR